ncbi:U3 snoRNP protein [Glugoides intestinalis]
MNPEKLERELILEKDWKLRGEAKASGRPVNSLVDADLDFETRLINIPVSKEENADIFKYITQRFREKTFDNYEFKEIKPKVQEETYDLTLVETNSEILDLYNKIEKEIRKMLDHGI